MSSFKLFNPAKIETSSVSDEVYPSSYEVKGAGSAVCNGTYEFAGICNKRPYYRQENGLAYIWYFYTSAFPLSMWTGWYISKEANTSSVSASSDYYSAYVHSKLPPSASQWVTRAPGVSPTAVCGHNPSPSSIEPLENVSSPSKNASRFVGFDKAEGLVAEGAGCSEVFHKYIYVSGAGKDRANGVYEFRGEMNNRPYYYKQNGEKESALWYFNDCPLNKSTKGMISYNGWYISKWIDTSSFTAINDMYSCYLHSALPPVNQDWVTRLPGITPTAGCGINPPPKVQYVTKPEQSQSLVVDESKPVSYLVQLLRIMLPSGQSISIPISEQETIGELLIQLESYVNVPFYDIKLQVRDAELKSYNKPLFTCSIMKGDILIATISPAKPLNEAAKQVRIIGAGPVGLWIAIHLKSYCPTWSVTSFEKRHQYTRSHALRLDAEAFENLIPWVAGRPGAAELKMCKEKWFPRTRTAIVEEDLRLLAQSIGILIEYNAEVTIKDLLQSSNQKADIIICCDGARSNGRKELISYQTSANPQELRDQKQLGSLLQVKFDALGEVKTSKGVLAQFMQNISFEEHFFSILCGNYDAANCTTPMTIFALINDEVAQSLQSSSASEASTHIDTASSAIRKELDKLLLQVCPAGIKTDSLVINVLPVAYSIANQICYNITGEDGHATAVYLAGDAAMGLPLEKGLNFGWRIASRFSSYLAHSTDTDFAQRAYEAYFGIMSEKAVKYVNKAYARYMQDIGTASFLRSFVQPFV